MSQRMSWRPSCPCPSHSFQTSGDPAQGPRLIYGEEAVSTVINERRAQYLFTRREAGFVIKHAGARSARTNPRGGRSAL